VLSESAYKEVCQQLMGKNPKSIQIIYDNYGDALYGIILRIVKNESDAAEVLQDTFVKIWENAHTYNPAAGRLFTWMSRIARNNSINKRNSKSSRMNQMIQSDENLVYLDDSARAATHQETSDLKGMLTKIDDKYSSVIHKLYFEGYTQKELSDELEIPLGTVKSRVKIGLRELRKFYDFGLTRSLITGLLTAGMLS